MLEVDSTKHIKERLRNIFHSVLIISTMLGLLGVAIVMVLGPAGWWLILSILIAVLISTRGAPLLVLKLYRAQPLAQQLAPKLYSILHALTRRAGLTQAPSLHYIPSELPIAFTAGTDKHTVLALSDGVIRNLNLAEITAIMAHEISHVRHRDIWVMSLADNISRMTALLSLTGFIVLVFISPLLLLSGEFPPLLAMLVLALAPNLTTLLQLALSRTREFAADLAAVKLTGDPLSLMTALQKLEAPKPSWLSRMLFPQRHDPNPSLLRTHPSTEERIRRLQAVARQQGQIEQEVYSQIHEDFPHFVVVKRKPRRHWSGLWY